MKFRICVLLLAVMVFLSCGFAPYKPVAATTETDGATVPEVSKEEMLLARIENMLAHNFVYNDDFDFTEVMVDNAMLALISACDEDGYLDRALAEGFVFNMYGFDLTDYKPSDLFPEKEGKLFVIPRGADTYSHEVLNVLVDGEYIIVDSSLVIESHDCGDATFSCCTLFKENPDSSFGYNIVSSIYY